MNYKLLCHFKLVFLSDLKMCSHKCYEVLLHGVKPRLSDHPEGGPTVCSSDIRRRVRSVWPSGGAHLLRRTWSSKGETPCSKKDERGPDLAGPLYECSHGCPSTPVHPPARMLARTYARTHVRTHARTHARTHSRTHSLTHVRVHSPLPSSLPPVIHNIVNPTHTPGPNPISIWDKAGATLPEDDTCKCEQRNVVRHVIKRSR